KNKDNQESFVLSLSYGKIIPKKDINEGLVPDNYSGYQIVKPGYIIVRCTDLQNDKVSLRTALVQHNGIISGAYLGLIPRDSYNSSFLQYLLFDWDISKELYRYGSGLRQSLSWEDIKYLLLPIPPIEEQEAIVSYLDKVTADIDKAIAAKERIIASLEERRKIIITHAVTRGINPDVPMKDSGIDWLGEIPTHWEVIRIKYLLNEKKARSKTGTEEPLSMSQRKGLIPTKMMGVIPNLAASYVDAKLVSKGDLVFNKLKAHLGVFNVSEYDGLVSPDYAVYNTTGKADLKFLEYIFKTPNCINEFKKLITGVGAGLSRLYTTDLYSIYCAIPPIDEQLAIRNHIVNQTKAISEAIDQCQSIIDLLRERKNIIINETVTGKVKVI
ncbi:restriction endonuclease subunit S, partial [Bacteroides acidifaciens]|uniref:restriction endonuclease subunit S n=1 Tax=Bacteroides acidifaciens TaxID=85831 RepID=UPI0025AE3E78